MKGLVRKTVNFLTKVKSTKWWMQLAIKVKSKAAAAEATADLNNPVQPEIL